MLGKYFDVSELVKSLLPNEKKYFSDLSSLPTTTNPQLQKWITLKFYYYIVFEEIWFKMKKRLAFLHFRFPSYENLFPSIIKYVSKSTIDLTKLSPKASSCYKWAVVVAQGIDQLLLSPRSAVRIQGKENFYLLSTALVRRNF